ncbi:MAG TPA: hypothetical protein VKB09_04380 [Thermomicrobiales bacterium]|nr:hypothetical protein [Thermomicrobiales bacterium]
MLPYSAQDLIRAMEYEMKPEDKRRFGTHLTRDVRRDEDDRDDRSGPDRGERFSLRLFFLRGATLARGT